MNEPQRMPPERMSQIHKVPPPETQLPSSGLGVAGLVTGIIGAIFFWIPFFGIILSILAIVFGGVGVYQTRAKTRSGAGMAIAGFVLGIIGLALFILMFTFTMMSIPR